MTMTYSDALAWRETFDKVADALYTGGLGLSEACTITVETNGATGGYDVTIEGVAADNGTVDGLMFVTRKLHVSRFNGVERVE